jgi:predicted transcriptional regulator
MCFNFDFSVFDLLMKKDLMHVSGLEEICPKVTRRTLQRDLNNLIELNLVRLKGAARQSNYELAK